MALPAGSARVRGDALVVPRRDDAGDGARDGWCLRTSRSRDRAGRVPIRDRAPPGRVECRWWLAMLREAELIVIGVLIAAGLVVLGALELVWPTRPRHPTRRSVGAPDPWRRALERGTVPTWPATMATDPVNATEVRTPTAEGESVPT